MTATCTKPYTHPRRYHGADVARWTTRALSDYVGGLSSPSKMPGFGYSLPASDCIVGGKLRTVDGSTCQNCYAHKGRYTFPVVQRALRRRARAIGRKYWTAAMAELVRRKCQRVPYFRWHDSGDLQSVAHFRAICDVARATPSIAHWLPTREYRIVADYVEAGGDIPPNLNVRLSAHMIGGHVPTFPRLRGLATVSTVSAEPGTYADARACPAPTQGNSCGDCRACWQRDVPHVTYALH